MNARFTLVGFENLLNSFDESRSLKDPWILDGCEDFSAETLLSTIMLKGAQMEPLYSDPVFFYRMNNQWWNKWKPTFAKWCAALHAEYNPLWNKDYYEDEHQDILDVGTLDTITKNKETVDDDTSYQRSGTDDTTTETRVSAYDSDNPTYQPYNIVTTDEDYTERGTGTDDKTTNFNGDIDTDTTNDRDHDRSFHGYGNIGITTSQSLVKEELELRYWNFYDHVSDIFLDEMAIRVY